MAIYNGPKCKLCRREGRKLMLKGERCKSEKCAMERKPYSPGMRSRRRPSTSEYNNQLREKQRLRRMYGLMERQFLNYFKKANRTEGVTGERLLQLLEQRFDNIVYRVGFAPSRHAARQLVLHNHILLNGKKANIPSITLGENDVIQVRENSRNMDSIHASLKNIGDLPDWLEVDKVNLTGKLLRVPERGAIPVEANERLVVELYSK